MRPAELEELLGKLESQRGQLLGQLRQMTDEEAGRRPSEGQWSAKEQVAHLTTYERLWLGWTLTVRDEPGSQVGPTKPNPEAYPEAQTRSLDDLLQELATARKDTVAAIEVLTAEELQRRGKHLLFGEMTVLQMLRSLYRHDRMHMDQMAGRESSFKPEEPRAYPPPTGS
jgi:uncharacterized damage-inducible protein DinB